MNKGHPIQLLKETKETFVLNTEALQEILENDKIRDKPVVVISIAGDMRRGKSFMLNFFLKYLQAEDKDNWLGEPNVPLNGFSWKNGTDCDTTGIILWSEPHVMTCSNGEEYAILLMDTQGTFDKKSTMKKNAMIFALSTMISSMQIFNINSQIREDKLEFLSLFINYGRLALEKDEEAQPFQGLQFLVRDWNSPYKHPYGMDGGRQYLDDFLMYDENDNSQVIDVRKFIQKCFSRIDCCLMPFPGSKVMSSEVFDGKLSDIKKAFVENLRSYVPHMLSEKYLLPKAINGCNITCQELLEYFKVYFRVFNSDDLVAPAGIFDASAEASNLAAVSICKRFYNDQMEKLCGGNSKHLSESMLNHKHQAIYDEAVAKFNARKKFGHIEHSDKYRAQLEEELKECFKIYADKNSNKNNLEHNLWTLVLLVVWYMLGQVLRFTLAWVGLDAVVSWIGWLLMVVVLTAIAWVVSYFTDNKLRDYIDEVTNASWESMLKPVYAYAVHKLVHMTTQRTLGAALPAR